jgi:large subunit ribosomal protein L14
MIQTQTISNVADNPGAKTVKRIKTSKKSKSATVGDRIPASARSIRSGLGDLAKKSSGRSLKKGSIFKALVIRTKKKISNREYGHALSFQSNDVASTNSQDYPIGSRIFGPITRELRAKNLRKVISQSKRML